jgi:hypothetical protein
MSEVVDARLECITIEDSDGEEDDDDDEWNIAAAIEEEPERRPRIGSTDNLYQELARLLTGLACLPNLRNLSLADYYSQPVWREEVDARCPSTADRNEGNDLTYPLPSPRSQLRSIIIDRGNISAGALSSIIEGCSNLMEFRYLVCHTPEVFGMRFRGVQYQQHLPEMSIEAVCGALLKHAKSTLQHLHIELAEYGSICGCRHEPCLQPDLFCSINPATPPTTDWKWNGFAALERLTLDIDLFSNIEGGGWLPFAKTLPLSIKDILILAPRCPPETDNLDFENMFRDFRPQKFANLRSISAWHRNANIGRLGHNGAKHILAHYRVALINAGIAPAGITEYTLDGDYFARRDKAYRRPYAFGMNQYGRNDYSLYSLPEEDLMGRVVFGVYHSEGGVRDRRDVYTGVIVEKTWI